VILPFANLDPEPDQQYFSDGLTEELIHALTRIAELRVIAWNTATHFRAEQDMANIRDQLGVSYVLRGAVRRTGQRLRITAQLIDACTGSTCGSRPTIVKFWTSSRFRNRLRWSS